MGSEAIARSEKSVQRCPSETARHLEPPTFAGREAVREVHGDEVPTLVVTMHHAAHEQMPLARLRTFNRRS